MILFQFYSLDVYGENGKPLNIKQLYKQLKWIADNTPKTAPPIGILTMEHRHNWAKTYKKMMKGKTNVNYHINLKGNEYTFKGGNSV